ncbi:MAG: COX15/CtaA family protein [Solirubrobacterales bacterium]
MSEGQKERFTLSPKRYEQIALFALCALTAIVFTGAAVRLTASGLGCPDWPRCYGKPYPPLNTHSIIEFGNRAFSGLVTIGVFAAAIGAMRRRPYRRDLVLWAWLLPLGALAQAVLGALTVESELQYGWVMAHFGLSMVMMIAAAALYWRSKHEADWRPPATDRLAVWFTRFVAFWTFLTVFSGTLATASGPHAGGKPGEVARYEPRGGGSLEWVVHRHGRVADVLGILTIALVVLLWRRSAPRPLLNKSCVFAVLVGVQGLIGSIQWQTQLPSELVWLHVVFATFCWIAALWMAFEAGWLRGERQPASEPDQGYENAPLKAS